MRPRQLGLTVVGSVLGAALLATGFVVSKNGLVDLREPHAQFRQPLRGDGLRSRE